MKLIVTSLAILCCVGVFGQNTRFQKTDSIIGSKIKKDGPGIMVGIVKDGNIIYEKYLGFANMEHRVKINEKTRSNIASTAKQFTALMILQLSLEGKISLEDDVRKYLTSLYPKVKEPIKIRHLINHTSGIRDYVELMSLQNKVWWKQVGLDNDDILELIQKQEDLGFTPGSDYSYSNSNYNLLAKVVEKVTGKKFTTYSTKFFKDLGLNSTEFIRRYMQVIPNRADPYSDWGYGELFHSSSVTKTAGEGFLYTTLKDQLKFEQAIQNANKNDNILLIKSQKPIPNSEIKTYGFGLKLTNRLNRKTVYHDGVTHAYNCQTLRFPEDKLSIFIMSNNGNIRSDLIADEIAKVYLPKSRKEAKYDQRFFNKADTKKDITILGKYNYPNNKTIVQIIKKEDKTYWKEPSFTLEMVPLKKNSFSFAYDPKLKIVFYENEMVEYYPSGKVKTYKKNLTPKASFADMEGCIGTYYNKELELGFEVKLSKNKELQFKFSNDKKFQNITVYNKINAQIKGIYIDFQRDSFNRVIKAILNYNRAKNMTFIKKTKLKFQPKILTDNGSIQVTTIASKDGNSSDILLTKNFDNGNEIWAKRLGGKSWDKANSIINTKDGYLIVGSTSSYGKGNYDLYVIKTDKNGKKIWQNTYGAFWNDYGYIAQRKENGYLIKGTTQKCTSNTDVFNRKCSTNVWFVTIDKNGKEISNQILEKIE